MTLISSSASGNAEFKRADLYQQVTDTIIRQLEAGVVPWQRGWKGDHHAMPGIPLNYATGNKYRGINIVLLWCANIEKQFDCDQWATMKQWNDKKEFIKKGQTATKIVKFDVQEKEVDGETVKIPFLKAYNVFNRCQLQSYAPETPTPYSNDGTVLVEKIEAVEYFIENTKATVGHIGSEACYMPEEDMIYMPDMERFITTDHCTATENYYAVLMHELVHWTGADKRLNRTKGRKFGDREYAQEELTAEFGASFLTAGFGLPTADKGSHAAYIDNWLQALRNDKYCLIKAAGLASKAVDYLHGIQPTYAPE